MKKFFVLVSLLALFLMSSAAVSACSCAGEQIPCEAYSEASAVFLGTVIESRPITTQRAEYEENSLSVKLSIDTPFRGIEGAETEVITGLGGGDCGFSFTQARQYLVYAYRNEGKLHTGICTRTRLASRAAEDLAYLRGLSKSTAGAAITGKTSRYQRDENGNSKEIILRDVTITIDGPTDTEVKTDAKGEFRVTGLAPGAYVVRVKPPAGLSLRGEPEEKVQLPERGCSVVNFWFENDGRIRGRVLNPQGLPVNNAEIFLTEAGKERYRGHWDAAYSKEDGTYAFKLVPPGRYILTIRFDGMTSQKRPFPEMYYPGVTDKAQAKIITIDEGGHLDKYDLEMPPLPLEYDIEGVVIYADGRPAPTASVTYTGGQPVAYSMLVDQNGRFSFKAYEGLKLSIGATVQPEKGKYLNSDQMTFVVAPGMPQIKLTIPSP